ncbi:MAG TPA: GAF domain-containing protein [Acidimicrobiales bacterium]|nr:GAF domain-containing protein [Acidimicrobiales bacterium]
MARLSEVHGAERPELSLKRVISMAQATIVGCDGAAVTLVRDGRAMPVVSTTEMARELDSIQCRTGEGPSLDAIRQLQVFNVATGAEARSWPGFSKEATARGVLSTLSVPLTVGGEAIGALNFYSRSADAFVGCEAVAVVFGCEAATTVSGALPGIRPAPEDRTAAV